MTGLGVACLLAVALALSQRGARVFGWLVLAHWATTQTVWRLAGDGVYAYLMPRDIVLGALAAALTWRRPSWSRVVITLCLAAMSLSHVAYWTALSNGVYAGETYMGALNVLFCAVLLALGVSGGRGAYGWFSDRLRPWLGPRPVHTQAAGAKRPCQTP